MADAGDATPPDSKAGPGPAAVTDLRDTDLRDTDLPDIEAGALLRWRREQLRHGGTTAELNWLLELHAGLSWHDLQRLALVPGRVLTLRVPLSDVAALWQRHRRSHEPLQYLVGRCPWRDLEILVTPDVLIPRQETELLIELALRLVSGDGPRRWADLGTGSGCLAVALARAWPHSLGLAVDLSDEALTVARSNLRHHDLLERVELHKGDWWQPLRPLWGQLELVVANPPYIPDAVWAELEAVVRDHEPRLALSSGADGLDAIRVIAADAAEALAPGGWLLLEHHHDQSDAVLALLREAGLDHVQAHRDLEGVARFVAGRSPAAERDPH